MPNHYDIDIECVKCGAYMFTIRPDEIRGPVSTICENCRVEKVEDNLGEIYKHNKTGNLYEVVDKGIINATNGCKDQIMVMYRNAAWKTFVREEKEFLSKFTAVHKRAYKE